MGVVKVPVTETEAVPTGAEEVALVSVPVEPMIVTDPVLGLKIGVVIVP